MLICCVVERAEGSNNIHLVVTVSFIIGQIDPDLPNTSRVFLTCLMNELHHVVYFVSIGQVFLPPQSGMLVIPCVSSGLMTSARLVP